MKSEKFFVSLQQVKREENKKLYHFAYKNVKVMLNYIRCDIILVFVSIFACDII